MNTRRTRVLLPTAYFIGLLMLQGGCTPARHSAEGEGRTNPSMREDKMSDTLRVGAAAVELKADDDMDVGGGIFAARLQGQEGQLRAVAVVLDVADAEPLAIVACDVLMLTRDQLDPVIAEIESTVGIPAGRVLINATHTHHAPSTVTLHAYSRVEEFSRRVQRGIVEAVRQAHARLDETGPDRFFFRLGEESSVGMNSRLLLSDGAIFWIGPRDDVVRPTGPFDPELPVLAFGPSKDELEAVIFNHSAHTIGIRDHGRSPSFYGLAAQELEQEINATVCFVHGASGSTHRLNVDTAEAVIRIKAAVERALGQAEPRPVNRLAAIKREFTFRVRRFDESAEHAAVTAYCKKRTGDGSDAIIEAFRKQRETLAPHQGEPRKTWLQVMLVGDVAIVGVPAEFFTVLGEEIKRRSPFRYTYVASLANDWIGYLPDREGHKLGGYQTWTGLHSFAEPGTGEAVVDETVRMLHEITGSK